MVQSVKCLQAESLSSNPQTYKIWVQQHWSASSVQGAKIGSLGRAQLKFQAQQEVGLGKKGKEKKEKVRMVGRHLMATNGWHTQAHTCAIPTQMHTHSST